MNNEIELIGLFNLIRKDKDKAPEEIEIKGIKYYRIKNNMLDDFYQDCNGDGWCCMFDQIYLDTRIKILDKPIIEDLEIPEDDYADPNEVAKKINEIIRYLRDKE